MGSVGKLCEDNNLEYTWKRGAHKPTLTDSHGRNIPIHVEHKVAYIGHGGAKAFLAGSPPCVDKYGNVGPTSEPRPTACVGHEQDTRQNAGGAGDPEKTPTADEEDAKQNKDIEAQTDEEPTYMEQSATPGCGSGDAYVSE